LSGIDFPTRATHYWAVAAVEGGIKTFLIADIRGYTRFTAERGDEAAAELAAGFADIVRRAVEERDGRLIELRGDEALVAFDSARQAVRSAVELQQRFQELPLGVGIGLDAGEAVPVGDGYRGGALNLAARMCSLAGPGEVLATETVPQLARVIDGIQYGERRVVRVKGIDKPVTAVEVLPVHEGGQRGTLDRLRRRARRAFRKRRGLLVAFALVVAAAGVAAAVALLAGGSTPRRAGQDLPLLPDSVAAIDSASGQIVSDRRLGRPLADLAAGSGRIWVLGPTGRTVTALAPAAGGGARSFALRSPAAGQWPGGGTADTATDLVALDGSDTLSEVTQGVGVDAGVIAPTRGSIKPLPATAVAQQCSPYVTGEGTTAWFSRGRQLAAIDVSTGLVSRRLTLPLATNAPRTITCYGVRYTGGRLFASRSPDAAIGIVDPTNGRFEPIVRYVPGVTAAEDADHATPWAATPETLWIDSQGKLLGVDIKSGKTAARIPLGSSSGQFTIDAGGAIWALDRSGRTLLQVDPAAKRVVKRIRLARPARGIASGYGRVWLTTGPA
jgi:class 3 adenylate cyclase